MLVLALSDLAAAKAVVLAGADGWSGWWTQNDGVMGGVSSGSMSSGGTFSGVLRLEQNGGFSSVGKTFSAMKDVTGYSGIEVTNLVARLMCVICVRMMCYGADPFHAPESRSCALSSCD
jgi:hypothetical protein